MLMRGLEQMLLKLHQAHYRTLLLKVGSGCSPLKVDTCEAGLIERKVFFISKTGNLGEKVDSCPEADSPLRVSGQELTKGSFRDV